MKKLYNKIKNKKEYKLRIKHKNSVLRAFFRKNKHIHTKPQIKGVVLKVFTITPKKPNSALRKVCKVFTKSIGTVIAYIPGMKHSISIHNEVLICPGKIQDLVNVNYIVIRGVYDAKPPIRTTARSKYGTPKPSK